MATGARALIKKRFGGGGSRERCGAAAALYRPIGECVLTPNPCPTQPLPANNHDSRLFKYKLLTKLQLIAV